MNASPVQQMSVGLFSLVSLFSDFEQQTTPVTCSLKYYICHRHLGRWIALLNDMCCSFFYSILEKECFKNVSLCLHPRLPPQGQTLPIRPIVIMFISGVCLVTDVWKNGKVNMTLTCVGVGVWGQGYVPLRSSVPPLPPSSLITCQLSRFCVKAKHCHLRSVRFFAWFLTVFCFLLCMMDVLFFNLVSSHPQSCDVVFFGICSLRTWKKVS